MYGILQGAKQLLRGGAACLLALALLGSVPTGAAEMTNAASAPKMLVPVGHTVGVKLFARGVVVVKLGDGETPAQECGLQTGDVIVKCGGNAVTSTEQFQSLLQESGGDTTALQIQRQGSPLDLTVAPAQNDQGVYCIGAWIRDSMAGIGTVTYYDPETGNFGALGHGITDVDTAQLMPFADGSVLASKVKAVKKGQSGCAGELRGDFDLSCDLGALYANTASGIFGTLDTESQTLAAGEALPLGQASVGPATILCNVEGDAVTSYDIEILTVLSDGADGRDMVISVTDPALIAITGGIVQGMSGSPIIQDEKLVGAVTHVLLNDPTTGYGISIDRMLSAADS